MGIFLSTFFGKKKIEIETFISKKKVFKFFEIEIAIPNLEKKNLKFGDKIFVPKLVFFSF